MFLSKPIIVASIMLFSTNGSFGGDEDGLEWRTRDGRPRAKAVNILRVSIEVGECEISGFRLESSKNGSDYGECDERELAREPRPFATLGRDGQNATLTLALSGAFTCDEHFLEDGGVLWLRLTLEFKNDCASPRVIEEEVQFERPFPSDVSFLRTLGNSDFHGRTIGRDPVEAYPVDSAIRQSAASEEDHRARLIIRRIFKVMKDDDPFQVFVGQDADGQAETRAWADALWQLTQQFPDSSYAPYAAYYVACAQGVQILMSNGQMQRDRVPLRDILPRLAALPEYARCREALTFAVERGDPYLEPKVLLFRGRMAALGGQLDEAEKWIERALDEAPGDDKLSKQAAAVREDLRRAREQLRQ